MVNNAGGRYQLRTQELSDGRRRPRQAPAHLFDLDHHALPDARHHAPLPEHRRQVIVVDAEARV